MRRGTRSAIALAVTAAVIAGGIWGVRTYIDRSQVLVSVECTTSVGPHHYKLDPEQAGNAATISAVAVGRQLPARATSIALATAMQESKLRNLAYGDTAGPDSRGLFQQRPSQGWGTEAEVMDPVHASGAFFDELVTFDYRSMSVTAAAQKVQRSAFPEAYAAHEAAARAYASALTGESASALTCSLRRTTRAGDAAKLAQRIVHEYGGNAFSPRSGGDVVTVRASTTARGWALAQWAVAHAQEDSTLSVSYAGLTWTRTTGAWEPSEAADGASTVAIQLATAAGQG